MTTSSQLVPASQALLTLNREIGELTGKLIPATEDVIARHLQAMQSAGMNMPQGIKPDKQKAVYGFALDGVPAYGVKRSAGKLIRGEYENIRPGFIPTPPEWAAIARLEVKTVRDDLLRLREKESTLQAAVADKEQGERVRTDEEKERVRNMVNSVKLQTAAMNESEFGSMKSEMPFDNEQKQRYAKMLELKDATNVTAEQQAFRRMVSRKIEE